MTTLAQSRPTSAPAGIASALAPLRDRSGIAAGPHVAGAVAHIVAVLGCAVAWSQGHRLLAIACWPVIAWLHHAHLARLHEAVHSMLLRSRRANEFWGIVIGTLSLTPMSVYRDVHTRHHAHLGDAHDPEFWPYNLPHTSRAHRLAYAIAELLLGFVVTPALYSLRTLRAWPRHAVATRRRLVLEWSLLAAFATGLLVVVQVTGSWSLFAGAVLGPAWLTGLMQTVRKFTEHLGLAGDSILTTTRTVVYRGWSGRLLSRTQLHVEHHGTHHRWPRIPYRHLPAATAVVAAGRRPGRFYRTHFAAAWDALRHLSDPRVGRQWLAAGRGAGMQAG